MTRNILDVLVETPIMTFLRTNKRTCLCRNIYIVNKRHRPVEKVDLNADHRPLCDGRSELAGHVPQVRRVCKKRGNLTCRNIDIDAPSFLLGCTQ